MMSSSPRMMNLGLFVAPPGYHAGAWRLPQARSIEPSTSFQVAIDIVQQAERAKMDAIFFADHVAIEKYEGKRATLNKLEPLTSLAALAMLTDRIGLIATASTSFMEPFNLARQFATIDHLSHGRAAWNVVTSFSGAENF